MERGSDLHERVKDYARDNGIRHPRAYAELIEKGFETVAPVSSVAYDNIVETFGFQYRH